MVGIEFSSETGSRKGIVLPRYFLIVFFVVSAAVAGLTLEMFRSYTTDFWFLVSPAGSRGAVSDDQIVEDAVELPRTLGFYDLLLSENRDITDPWKSLSPEDRRDSWLGYVRTERVGRSGIVRMTVSGNSGTESRVLTERVARTLDAMLDRSTGSDISIRVVDGPYSQVSVRHPFLWGVASLSSGLLISIIVFFGARVSSRLATSATSRRFRSFPDLDARTGAGSRFRSQLEEIAGMSDRLNRKSQSESAEQPGIYRPLNLSGKAPSPRPSVGGPKAEAETVSAGGGAVSSEHTSAAPSNLPFAADDFSWEKQLPGLATGPSESVTEPVPTPADGPSEEPSEGRAVSDAPTPDVQEVPGPAGEPTEEELKRRLNQLLRGEL